MLASRFHDCFRIPVHEFIFLALFVCNDDKLKVPEKLK